MAPINILYRYIKQLISDKAVQHPLDGAVFVNQTVAGITISRGDFDCYIDVKGGQLTISPAFMAVIPDGQINLSDSYGLAKLSDVLDLIIYD